MLILTRKVTTTWANKKSAGISAYNKINKDILKENYNNKTTGLLSKDDGKRQLDDLMNNQKNFFLNNYQVHKILFLWLG